jgi:demethylmenaquinone methyltransferase/2-methoxy-6-polyprenyl-1,4-benzoquinol methylase
MRVSVFNKILLLLCELLDPVYFKRSGNNPRMIESMLISNSKGKLLDICTGTASNIIPLAKNNNDLDIVGIDINKDALRYGNRKIRKKGLGNNIQLMRMNAARLRFDNETFDFVTISLALHELKDEYARKILSEVKRVLKKDGCLLLVEWKLHEDASFIERLLFKLLKIIENKEFTRFIKIDLYRYMEENGFGIIGEYQAKYTQVLQLEHLR